MTAAKKTESKDEKKSLDLDGGDPPKDVRPAGATDSEKADKEMGGGEPDITDTKPHAPKSDGQAGTEDTKVDKADEKGGTKIAGARRTKAEKLTDDIEEAKALLSENGYSVKKSKGSKGSKREGDDRPSFDAAVQDKGVLSAQSGLVQGSIDTNMVSVPILRLSTVGWIGQAPLEIVASDIDDLREVLDNLESQI